MQPLHEKIDLNHSESELQQLYKIDQFKSKYEKKINKLIQELQPFATDPEVNANLKRIEDLKNKVTHCTEFKKLDQIINETNSLHLEARIRHIAPFLFTDLSITSLIIHQLDPYDMITAPHNSISHVFYSTTLIQAKKEGNVYKQYLIPFEDYLKEIEGINTFIQRLPITSGLLMKNLQELDDSFLQNPLKALNDELSLLLDKFPFMKDYLPGLGAQVEILLKQVSNHIDSNLEEFFNDRQNDKVIYKFKKIYARFSDFTILLPKKLVAIQDQITRLGDVIYWKDFHKEYLYLGQQFLNLATYVLSEVNFNPLTDFSRPVPANLHQLEQFLEHAINFYQSSNNRVQLQDIIKKILSLNNGSLFLSSLLSNQLSPLAINTVTELTWDSKFTQKQSLLEAYLKINYLNFKSPLYDRRAIIAESMVNEAELPHLMRILLKSCNNHLCLQLIYSYYAGSISEPEKESIFIEKIRLILSYPHLDLLLPEAIIENLKLIVNGLWNQAHMIKLEPKIDFDFYLELQKTDPSNEIALIYDLYHLIGLYLIKQDVEINQIKQFVFQNDLQFLFPFIKDRVVSKSNLKEAFRLFDDFNQNLKLEFEGDLIESIRLDFQDSYLNEELLFTDTELFNSKFIVVSKGISIYFEYLAQTTSSQTFIEELKNEIQQGQVLILKKGLLEKHLFDHPQNQMTEDLKKSFILPISSDAFHFLLIENKPLDQLLKDIVGLYNEFNIDQAELFDFLNVQDLSVEQGLIVWEALRMSHAFDSDEFSLQFLGKWIDAYFSSNKHPQSLFIELKQLFQGMNVDSDQLRNLLKFTEIVLSQNNLVSQSDLSDEIILNEDLNSLILETTKDKQLLWVAKRVFELSQFQFFSDFVRQNRLANEELFSFTIKAQANFKKVLEFAEFFLDFDNLTHPFLYILEILQLKEFDPQLFLKSPLFRNLSEEDFFSSPYYLDNAYRISHPLSRLLTTLSLTRISPENALEHFEFLFKFSDLFKTTIEAYLNIVIQLDELELMETFSYEFEEESIRTFINNLNHHLQNTPITHLSAEFLKKAIKATRILEIDESSPLVHSLKELNLMQNLSDTESVKNHLNQLFFPKASNELYFQEIKKALEFLKLLHQQKSLNSEAIDLSKFYDQIQDYYRDLELTKEENVQLKILLEDFESLIRELIPSKKRKAQSEQHASDERENKRRKL